MKYSLTLVLLFLSSNAWALFCPTTLHSINLGDTLAHVQQQCSKPASQTSYKSSPPIPQEWNYYLNPDSNHQTTFKMSVAFDNDKVINITVNGFSLTNTEICGATIRVGDS